MGIKFDGTGDYYAITDNADLDLGSNSWALGFWLWTDSTSNAGTSTQYLFSTKSGGWPGSNTITLVVYEDSHSTKPGWMRFAIRDSTSSDFCNSGEIGNGDYTGDGKWRLFVCNFNDTTNISDIWQSEIGGVNAWSIKSKDPQGMSNVLIPNDMHVGRQYTSSGYFQGKLAEFFIMPTQHLTLDEVIAMSCGMSILDLGYNPATYVPMTEAVTTVPDLVGSNSMAENGGNQVTSDHPPMLPMQPIYVGAAEAAAPTLEQEGFRWRNDDGTEITATWKETPDTNTTIGESEAVRLRVLVNSSGDTPAGAVQLEVKKTSESDTAYTKIV